MPRNTSWLSDAYTASKMRKPMDMAPPATGGMGMGAGAHAATPGLPPPMMTGGAAPAATMPKMPAAPAAGPLAGMPSLGGGGTMAGAATGSPAANPAAMQSLIAAFQRAHGMDTNGDGIPDSGGGVAPKMPNLMGGAGAPGLDATPRSPGGQRERPRIQPPIPRPNPNPEPVYNLPPDTSTPGPGPVGSTATGAYSSPQAAYQQMLWDIAHNPDAWKQYGLGAVTGPGAAGLSWMQYILADPYNRMITDASERESLEGTNTAFDAARGKMRQDQLQSGAGGSGVAAGQSRSLELSRGAAQAKNVRDFEKFKTEKGDQRLMHMGLPSVGQNISAMTGAQQPQQSGNSTDQWLQLALQAIGYFA